LNLLEEVLAEQQNINSSCEYSGVLSNDISSPLLGCSRRQGTKVARVPHQYYLRCS
jgi:hypothetical protein